MVVWFLAKIPAIQKGSSAFGKAFEHFIFCEVRSYIAYCNPDIELTYWRTSSGYEVDFILGNAEVAIEVKASETANDNHLKGLRAIGEEHACKKRILVSCDPRPRKTGDGIDILPWQVFCDNLWSGNII